MATRRKSGKQGPAKKPAPRLSQEEADDLALAEELLRPPSPQEQAAIEAELKKFHQALRKLGIRLPAKPISAQELYEMGLREGLNPEGNEFSRGILEMREE